MTRPLYYSLLVLVQNNTEGECAKLNKFQGIDMVFLSKKDRDKRGVNLARRCHSVE